jgi:hypothetical protein
MAHPFHLQNLIKCPACSTPCRPGSLCATCAQPRLPLTISSLPVESVPVLTQQQLQQHRQQAQAGRQELLLGNTGPGPGAGGVPDDGQLQELERLMPLAHLTSLEQRPLPLMPEPLPADGQRPASTHYGPFLIANLLADACRYNAGRSTDYALGFAAGLAELWPRMPLQLRRQLRYILQQLIEQDDEARATGGGSDPYPLGMDEHRAAWLQVRQAWLQDAAAGA